MKKYLALSILLIALLNPFFGCAQEDVTLSRTEVATLQAKFGSDLEAMRADLEARYNVRIDALTRKDGEIVATLPSLAVDIAEQTAKKVVSSLPSTAGDPWAMIGSGLGGILAGFGVAGARNKFKKAQKPTV